MSSPVEFSVPVQAQESESVKWSSMCFLQEGDVWPNSTAEVNIVFKPQEAKLYQQTVYCDITGTLTAHW